MSDIEFDAHQKTLRIERERHLKQKADAEAAYTAEGQAIKAGKLKDRAFTVLPAKERVDYWRTFQRQYPGVDVSEQVDAALGDYQPKSGTQRSGKNRALEIRVAQAEQEAAARLEAEKLRKETERLRHQQNYGLRYYTDPLPRYPNYYYRPPP